MFGLVLPLMESAALAFVAISFLLSIFNSLSFIKNFIPNRTMQLGSAFGNTGYYGIPVSMTLVPNHALIYNIDFELGATLVIRGIGPIPLTDTTNLSIPMNIVKVLSKQNREVLPLKV